MLTEVPTEKRSRMGTHIVLVFCGHMLWCESKFCLFATCELSNSLINSLIRAQICCLLSIRHMELITNIDQRVSWIQVLNLINSITYMKRKYLFITIKLQIQTHHFRLSCFIEAFKAYNNLYFRKWLKSGLSVLSVNSIAWIWLKSHCCRN